MPHTKSRQAQKSKDKTSPYSPCSHEELYQEACQVIPGGVNSPVRACQAVGAVPRFVKRGLGSRIYDENGVEYIDLVCSWGPLIFGHRPPSVAKAVSAALDFGSTFGAPTIAETTLAKLICRHMPSVEMVRLVSSGTEAAMSAIRLARGATNRDRIIKFNGCYHGHADSLLVAAGSGLATFSLPGSLGVPKALANLTITCPYNDPESLTEIFRQIGHEVAAVIVEPIAGNMGVVPPKPGFLETAQNLCREYGALLIFDEVITGFRVGLGGAQGFYGLKPDLTVLGKVIGGGLPLAAFGGRRDLMELLAPLGGVYQAGTLSGNPLAVAAGIATIERLEEEKGLYGRLDFMSSRLAEGLTELAKTKGLPSCVNRVGSMSTLFFTEGPVYDFDSASRSDTWLYGAWYRAMLKEGVWLPPSQFETMFVSAGFLFDEIDIILDRAENALATL
ncbi:MAG: glutamate-1-semialdehyde 2,1-aminomutase [Deltaproteobacteria bacterium]|jgi:glutamate-1-semialdehyde 2,1-aminomutase|nr:glutamate-1-semialdehyde 2,1-aminomutase [Deltaproteobacteria bacterium]